LQRLRIRVLRFALTVTLDSATAALVAGDKHDDSNDVLPIVATSKPGVVDERTGYVSCLPTTPAWMPRDGSGSWFGTNETR
jgi:hypothetical protein